MRLDYYKGKRLYLNTMQREVLIDLLPKLTDLPSRPLSTVEGRAVREVHDKLMAQAKRAEDK